MKYAALTIVAVLEVAVSPAHSATVILDPPSVNVVTGQLLSIALDIHGIGSVGATEVGSFDSFVGFDPTLLMSTGVTFGSLLGDPAAFEALTTTLLGPNSIEAAEVSLLPSAALDSLQASSDFTLATYSFQALRPGTANFSYLGGPVDDGDGLLIAGTKTVPEPSEVAILLFFSVVGGCFYWKHHRKFRRVE